MTYLPNELLPSASQKAWASHQLSAHTFTRDQCNYLFLPSHLSLVTSPFEPLTSNAHHIPAHGNPQHTHLPSPHLRLRYPSSNASTLSSPLLDSDAGLSGKSKPLSTRTLTKQIPFLFPSLSSLFIPSHPDHDAITRTCRCRFPRAILFSCCSCMMSS
jgi:hypothetical protein